MENEQERGRVTHTGESVDVDICQECGVAFNPTQGGHFVDSNDVGPDAKGGTAEIFRLDVEDRLGKTWLGFKPEDVGPWCEQCSWIIQRRRTDNGGRHE